MQLLITLLWSLCVGAKTDGCISPYVWYRLHNPLSLQFVNCTAESGSDTFAQGSICDIDCPHNAISTVRNVTCECSPRKSQDGEVCRWSPHRRYQTIKCYGGDRSEYLRANPQFDILLGAKSKKDRTDGQKRHRARPRGLSGKSQLRMTSQDVVFTKNHAKQLRELGFHIPAQRIIQPAEIFGRAVLKEDVGMGKRWTFYGRNGVFGTSKTPDSMFFDNPWAGTESEYVVPYYFDTSHSMTEEIRSTIKNHLTWMNGEFNHCLRFEQVNETMARTIDRKLQIVDGSGCWSYLGAIPADMTGQKLSLSDGCYGRGTTLHEFMHALGIDHEQNRPDREAYVNIHWDNIQSNKLHNFDVLSISEWVNTGHAYEYRSVMHYDGFDFSNSKSRPVMTIKTNGKDTGIPIRSQRDRPTTMDVAQICELYGCAENCGHSFWNCQNGEEIFTHRVCDGEADCTDGSDETNCNLGCCSAVTFGAAKSKYHVVGSFNNKDFYFSEDTNLFLYFQSGYWLFSRVRGSLSVVYFAVSSVNCVHDVPDFSFYDWEFGQWIGGGGPVSCDKDYESEESEETTADESTTTLDLTTTSTTTTTAMLTTAYNIEVTTIGQTCSTPPTISNGVMKCSRKENEIGTVCKPYCNNGYDLDCASFVTTCELGAGGVEADWSPSRITCQCKPTTCSMSRFPTSNAKPAYHWDCNETAKAGNVPFGTQCTAKCAQRESMPLIVVCDNDMSESTCGADGAWTATPKCHCIRNNCGSPKIFTPKQIRFGAKYHYSDHHHGIAGINSVVTAKCPNTAIMKCNGSSMSTCIWDGKRLTWDNSQKCSCFKSCAPPPMQVQFHRNVIMPRNCDNAMHGDICPLDCSDSDQVIHTDSAVSKKANISNLKCFCRRNQCHWRSSPTATVKSLYCAAENNCPNPAEYFSTGDDPNVELECFDGSGKQIVGSALAKRQSWHPAGSPAEQEHQPVQINADQFHLFQLFTSAVGKFKTITSFKENTKCFWKCKAGDQSQFRPKIIRAGVVCKCTNSASCHWKVRSRQVSSMQPYCF